MESMSSLEQLKKVYEAINEKKKVNLFGPPGAGKTWIAKRVTNRSNQKNQSNQSNQNNQNSQSNQSNQSNKHKSFDFALWVFLCRDYDINSLSESIGRELSLVPVTEEWEVVDDSNAVRIVGEAEDPETLIQMIRKKLKGKNILLILDDVLDEVANEEKFWSLWKEMLPEHDDVEKLHTVLISRSSRGDEGNPIEVKALPREDSISLLTGKLDARLKKNEKIQTLGKTFIEKSNGFPGTVTMIAKALNYFSLDTSQVSMLEKEVEEASENYNVNKLLCRMHNLLPIGVLKDLWWNGDHFFRDSGSVHYNELITYWILEGFIGSGSMTKLYERGHHILMELTDCGILKQQESGYLFMDKSLLDANDLYQFLDQIASLGLATVFKKKEGVSDPLGAPTDQLATVFEVVTQGFGNITYDDGMLKTPQVIQKDKNQQQSQSSNEEGQNLSTLLLDGTHFNEEVLMKFLESEKELQILALFDPTIKSLPKALPKPLVEMHKLRVLVLRGCAYLDNVNLDLKDLRVLEISGARSLEEMKPDFFNNMTTLQSLNLSELQLTSLPQSLYNLSELQWLVIKNCPKLDYVANLSKLKHLLALDLSGNTSLEYVDKNFLEFKNLQSFNLSNTKVSTTPLFRAIGELTHLLLRDCKNLGRIRGLTSLTKLKTLDLSGSTNFEEFHDPSLKKLESLQTLDLSGTTLSRLPLNIANPRCLNLKNCLNLKQISCIEPLLDLEVLDLSGSKNLSDIEDDFFESMKCLRVLKLSETNITVLPSLSNLSNLRELLLSRCTSLKNLPSLESATQLEILDVSKCSALEDIGNPSFEKMTRLEKLDLSETMVNYLPTLSNPSNLHQLLLKNCTNLQNLELNVSLLKLEVLNLAGITSFGTNGAEFVKDMSNLQILDLSNTSIEQLPSMSNLTNLVHLSLAGCKHLKTVPDLDHLSKLEVLDLSRSSVKHLPNFRRSNNIRKILLKDCFLEEDVSDMEVNDLLGPTPKIPHVMSELSHLDYLEYPNMKDVQGVEETSEDQWNICRVSDMNKLPLFLSGSQFLQILNKSLSLQQTFHLCAFPAMVEGVTGDQYLQRRELVFADVYFQTSQFAQYKEKRSLQIRGFNRSPKGIENIISHVNVVFLIDNKFKSLLSGLSASVLNKLKGCWIERCDEMVSIFDDPKSEIGLENLGISNNRQLVSIFNGTFESFNNLNTLYLDSCPKILTVFQSSWLPKTLKVLQIKNCNKIVSLFESEGELPHLETLHLWDLPELISIGVSFPSLQTLKIFECPKVKETEENFEFAKELKTLWISGATSLKNLYSGNQETHNFSNLETLKLESCPMLETVVSSRLQLNKINSIEIRCCEKLKTLFVHSNSDGYELPCLNRMQLEDLPLLQSIGATFPSETQKFIEECPNLQFEQTTDDQN